MIVSVIIPSYRPSEILLGHCLRSLDMQTVDKRSYEVIVVQNGPNENEEVLKYLEGQFPDLTLRILKSAQAGVSLARNLGIDAAEGDYLCFVDDDDWVSENFLELMMPLAAKDTVVASCFSARKTVNAEDERDYVGEIYRKFEGRDEVGIYEGRRFLGSACGKLIPRDVIGDIRFSTNFSRGEDALFMATISKNIVHLRPAPGRPMYYRRIGDNSASRSHKSFGWRLKNLLSLWSAYAHTYLSAPMKYNLRFFLNRFLASGKWLVMWGVR